MNAMNNMSNNQIMMNNNMNMGLGAGMMNQVMNQNVMGQSQSQMNQGMNNMNNNNMGMNNNMNQPNKDVIFNSSVCSNKYFVFSIDDSKIYYSEDNNYNFSILYDFNRQCLYGNEINNTSNNINLDQSYQTVAINSPINLNNAFKLSGKSQFNVKTFELYQILLGDN